MVLLGYGALNTYLYAKFTPVYTQTECGQQRAVLDELTLGAQSIQMGMQIEVMCMNPNPYAIKILASKPGRVFVGRGPHKLEIGKLKVLPGSSLREEGTGTVRVRMHTVLSGPEADSLLPQFLEDDAIPILMELHFDVGIYIGFGLGSWGTSAPFRKACGLNMAGLLVNQFVPKSSGPHHKSSRLGPLVCRNAFEGLEIPPVGGTLETPTNGRMGFSAAQVAPDEVQRGEQIKNVSLGAVVTLSYLVGLGFVYASIVSVARSSQARPHQWLPSAPAEDAASPRAQTSGPCPLGSGSAGSDKNRTLVRDVSRDDKEGCLAGLAAGACTPSHASQARVRDVEEGPGSPWGAPSPSWCLSLLPMRALLSLAQPLVGAAQGSGAGTSASLPVVGRGSSPCRELQRGCRQPATPKLARGRSDGGGAKPPGTGGSGSPLIDSLQRALQLPLSPMKAFSRYAQAASMGSSPSPIAGKGKADPISPWHALDPLGAWPKLDPLGSWQGLQMHSPGKRSPRTASTSPVKRDTTAELPVTREATWDPAQEGSRLGGRCSPPPTPMPMLPDGTSFTEAISPVVSPWKASSPAVSPGKEKRTETPVQKEQFRVLSRSPSIHSVLRMETEKGPALLRAAIPGRSKKVARRSTSPDTSPELRRGLRSSPPYKGRRAGS